MNAPNATSTETPNIPEDVRELLGKPTFVIGENPEQYEQLRIGLAGSMNPKNNSTWLAVGRMASSIWNTERLRRCQAHYYNYAYKDALAEMLLAAGPMVKDPDERRLRGNELRKIARDAANGDEQARAFRDAELAKAGLDEADAHGLVFSRTHKKMADGAALIAASELQYERSLDEFWLLRENGAQDARTQDAKGDQHQEAPIVPAHAGPEAED